MADGDGLTGQFVDESWKIYSFWQHHGDIVLQHLTETSCRAEQHSACARVRMVLVEFTEKEGKKRLFIKWAGSYSSRSPS